jgi:hypothetical protein
MKTIITIIFALIGSILSLAPSAYAEPAIQSPATANLIIYRPNDYSAMNYRIWVDGRYLGKLKRDKALELHVSPGEHVIRSNDRNRSELAVTVNEQGVTYVHSEIYRKTRIAITEVEGPQQAVAGL